MKVDNKTEKEGGKKKRTNEKRKKKRYAQIKGLGQKKG